VPVDFRVPVPVLVPVVGRPPGVPVVPLPPAPPEVPPPGADRLGVGLLGGGGAERATGIVASPAENIEAAEPAAGSFP